MLELPEHVKQCFIWSDGVGLSMLVTVNEFWSKVSNFKCEAGRALFPVLSKLVFEIIPQSNVESEQLLKLIKKKFRSKLIGNMLNGVLSVNFNMNSIEMAHHPCQEEYKDNESDFGE